MTRNTPHPPRIRQVLAVPAVGAGYYEDLVALQSRHVPLVGAGLPRPYMRFTAMPVTPGFRAVCEVAEAVSVGLVLDAPATGGGYSRQVAWGDCVAVSYSPIFRTEEGLAAIQRVVAPALEGRPLSSFRELAAEVDALVETAQVTPVGAGLPRPYMSPRPYMHTAIRYGVSQALLQAVALARCLTMAEVIAEEWGLPRPDAPVATHAQSGSERYHSAEKMIIRRLASLPHALVDDVPAQVGRDGGEMTRYIRWLSKRISELGGEGYHPTIHLDLHGALGQIYGDQFGPMLGQLYAWELAARPHPLRIESPVILDSRKAQIHALKTLREYVRLRRMAVQLVADEWANTLDDIHAFVAAGAADMIQIKMPDLGSIHNSVEAVLACKAASVGAFLGGSYAETDLSARVSVHVALATRPDLLMAKPGMGVDEAVSLAQNEMARALAIMCESGSEHP